MILDAETTTTFEAGWPPIVTIGAAGKLLPRIVIAVPPLDGPEMGITREIAIFVRSASVC